MGHVQKLLYGNAVNGLGENIRIIIRIISFTNFKAQFAIH
jgi:hypothetical protein